MNSTIQKLIMEQFESFEYDQRIKHAWEVARMKSLENWNMNKPSAKEMAEAGFYCPQSDVPGTVRCFSCFIELDGWEPTDKPWEEHLKRALTLDPPCKFIELGKKEADLLVKDFLEILKSVMLRIVKEDSEKSLNSALALQKKKKTALKKELQKLGIS
ncbi:baculoviral IAP repeat-containing protein 5.2-A-like [Daktulosphaira vitifoliae]|uniref:baculoviral IAP repeat-containing protein 5.2-A-like n=1 Tax=Daktulosphaira vitifoliae TaxID=58002 RepID=UPI0021AA9DD0|nr:baculoviral IAP repeat-containing protein 5.2-A-like [Daktulosphaira vitifoliae]